MLVALAVVAALAVSPTASAKPTVATIAIAITFCRPTLPAKTATSYARILVERAQKLGVDPLLMVAIVDHESGWREWVVSKDGEDHGLGQIRARYLPACAKDKDPVHAPSLGCAMQKKKLLDGERNLEAMADAIGAWIVVCKSTMEAKWLTTFAKGNKKGAGCATTVPTGVVREFLARRRALRLRLEALPPGLPSSSTPG